jgi:hypothetical protein
MTKSVGCGRAARYTRNVNRLPQFVLILSTTLASWLGMQAVHELGHVLGALLTGGAVERVVLHPLTISRTDLASNPRPLLVVWAGPLFGVTFPILLWLAARALRLRGAFVLRFFAGFCLIANGAYIGGGSVDGVGDCGQMLRHGSPLWHLWLFGLTSMAAGLGLWHKLGPHFGLGPARGHVDRTIAYSMLAVFLVLLVAGLVIGGY